VNANSNANSDAKQAKPDMISEYLDIHPQVAAALQKGAPVVALESTIIAHGLPWPDNLQCAQRLEQTIRAGGAVPATIGISRGRIRIGLDERELEHFARADNIIKVSRRDLAVVLARGLDGATTVAGTMICAHLAGIRVFATGGIGGVHRGAQNSMDVSADLTELGRTPVAVVCAGAKSSLDLPKTLEVLETQGVPVLGFGSGEFPAFYLHSSGLPVDYRVDTAAEVAGIIATQQQQQLTSGLLIGVPIPQHQALAADEVERWIAQALAEAEQQGVSGKAITPFLLARIATLSDGRALQANLALVDNNARVAADIACSLARITNQRA
jgi:pseudouridine-5'-phosphate glycosidase